MLTKRNFIEVQMERPPLLKTQYVSNHQLNLCNGEKIH